MSQVAAPLDDIVDETKRLVEFAEKRGIVLRLFGGLVVRFHCPSASHRSLQRKYADVDFMAWKKQSREIRKFFPEMGYAPREVFNAMSSDIRLIFNDIRRGRRIDIFLDVFEMCHKFDFRKRLTIDKPTIPLADLLATKLQVVEISEREYRDIIALLNDHTIGDSDEPETINASYLANLCANDWGIYKTFTVNIGHVKTAIQEYQLEDTVRETLSQRLNELQTRIENVPKSTGWRLRARIGEKKRWYELPEMDKEVVDSRLFGERKQTN